MHPKGQTHAGCIFYEKERKNEEKMQIMNAGTHKHEKGQKALHLV